MFITTQPINLAGFLLSFPNPSCGAVATFVGVVRDHHEGHKVQKLYYECYSSMANKIIQRIVQEVRRSISVDDIKVLHRMGSLEIGEVAVAIWVSSSHREEAFKACRLVIDRIKSEVPIWKKEIYQDGESQWVLCGSMVRQ